MDNYEQKKIILIIMLIAGFIIFYWYLMSHNFNLQTYKLYVLKSDSMAPLVRQGSLVVIDTHNTSPNMGDIITFYSPTSGQIITHQVIEQLHIENQIAFRTQGQKNHHPDPGIVSRSQIIGKVVLSLPLLGYLIIMAQTTLGLAVGVIVPVLVLVMIELREIFLSFKSLA